MFIIGGTNCRRSDHTWSRFGLLLPFFPGRNARRSSLNLRPASRSILFSDAALCLIRWTSGRPSSWRCLQLLWAARWPLGAGIWRCRGVALFGAATSRASSWWIDLGKVATVVAAPSSNSRLRTSSACVATASSCLRQKAACSSTISERLLAPAKLLARSKLEFKFRWVASMKLRLNAAAPWPAAPKDFPRISAAASRAPM